MLGETQPQCTATDFQLVDHATTMTVYQVSESEVE
jgi:hypothetical protein